MLVTVALLLALVQGQDLLSESNKALEAQKYDLAAELCQKAISASPGDYAARFQLALVYSLAGRDEEAIAAYRKVLEMKPGLREAEWNLAQLLVQHKQPREALPLLESTVNAQPKEFRPRLLLGDALFDTGEYAKAAAAYTAAVEIDAKSADAEFWLARAQLRLGQPEEAERHFRRAAELKPALQSALIELAPAYEKAGKNAEAIAIYQQFPENAAARDRLGQLLLQAGRAAEAIPHLEWAVGKSPTAANRLALAQAYRDTKQIDKEPPLLQQALQAEPDNWDLHLAYGRELRDQRKFAEAGQEFYIVVKARPNSLEAWNELAAMLISMERFPQALAALDRIKALGGEKPGQMYLRAITLDKIKAQEQALAAYRQFLAAAQGKYPEEEFKARQRARIIERELSRK